MDTIVHLFILYFFSRRTYGLLFDWLYPAHMPLVLKAISHWADVPQVCLFY